MSHNWGDHTGPRRGTPRIGWKQGPKSKRRLFLYELQRTNDIEAACKHARITPDLYHEWCYTGFLSPLQLEKARDFYAARHPEEVVAPQEVDAAAVVDMVELAVSIAPSWVWRIGNQALQSHIIGHYMNLLKAGKTPDRVDYSPHDDEYAAMHHDDWLWSEEYKHRARMKQLGMDVDMDDW